MPMRILFFTWPARLQRFLDVMVQLDGEGHELVVMSPPNRGATLPSRLADLERVRVETYEESSDQGAARVKAVLRMTHDYAWQLEPAARAASFNRRRSLDFLVRGLTDGAHQADARWPDPLVEASADRLATFREALRTLERKLPAEPHLVDLIRAQQADVVLVTPLVLAGSAQVEVVKAARAAGVPSGFPVYSWDNLTNKGLLHAQPDRVFVWNDVQLREAVDLHGVDPGAVTVTGAPRWDQFFAMSPTTDRSSFLTGLGLDPTEPLVLYLGSTSAVVPDETLVIERWLHALRESDGPLARANALVRPHPRERTMWSGWLPDHGRVAFVRSPSQADQELYDQLFHADAVVGLNTSAQIEAAILGKPVLTFAAGALAPGQEGSAHFHYLLSGRGGPVDFAGTLDEHVRQLERVLAGDVNRAAIDEFARSFVRPHGIDRPVSPILAEEIVRLGRRASS